VLAQGIGHVIHQLGGSRRTNPPHLGQLTRANGELDDLRA
jgi:hypothetical protein